MTPAERKHQVEQANRMTQDVLLDMIQDATGDSGVPVSLHYLARRLGMYAAVYGTYTLLFHLEQLVARGLIQQMGHSYPDGTTYRVPRPPKGVREARTFRLQ